MIKNDLNLNTAKTMFLVNPWKKLWTSLKALHIHVLLSICYIKIQSS